MKLGPLKDALGRRFWPGVTLGAAVLLAFSSQRLLARQPPALLPALLGFLGAAALLATPRSKLAAAYKRLDWPAMLLLNSLLLLALALALRPPTHASAAPAVRAWLAAQGLFLVACWLRDRQAGRPQLAARPWSWRELLWLLAIAGVGMFLRLPALERVPLKMLGDEGAMGLAARAVLQGQIQDPFATGWLSHGTLWFYLQAYSLQLFGDDLRGLRLLSAVIGSVTVVSTYLLGRLLYGRRVAAMAAFLLATYHFHIHFSRLALNNIVDPLLGTLLLLWLTLGLRSGRRLALGAAGITLGLGLYFYHGARLFLLLVLVLGLIQLRVKSRMTFQRSSVQLLLLGALLSSAPFLQTLARDSTQLGARYAAQGVTLQWLREESARTGRPGLAVLLSQARDAVLAFHTIPDRYSFYDHQRPLLWGAAAALMPPGLLLALWRARRWQYQVPLVWFGLAVLFGGMLMRAPPGSPRYVTLAPVICLFIALAISRIHRKLALLCPRLPHVPQLLVVALLCFLAYSSITGYFHDFLLREQLGGPNTTAAAALGRYLAQQPAGSRVWLFGAPRLYYHGMPMIDFLAPGNESSDINEPIRGSDAAPACAAGRRTVYVAIPERVAELTFVEERYAGGQWQTLTWYNDPTPLLTLYRLDTC